MINKEEIGGRGCGGGGEGQADDNGRHGGW